MAESPPMTCPTCAEALTLGGRRDDIASSCPACDDRTGRVLDRAINELAGLGEIDHVFVLCALKAAHNQGTVSALGRLCRGFQDFQETTAIVADAIAEKHHQQKTDASAATETPANITYK